MRDKIRSMPSVARDVLISAVFFLGCFALCRLLSCIDNDNNPFAPQMFTLAVTLISYFTRSYLPGILCSVLSVLCVNVFFTMPFYHFNLSGVGYPTTFVVMLTVSLLVSALTTRARREEKLRFEAETERIRGGLLRAISHDLRTPLTGIIGCSSALQDRDDLSENQRRDLAESIHTDALWLLRMTENILSVTKSQDGVAIRKTEESLEEVLSSAILKFRHNTGSDLPVSIQSNKELILVPMDPILIEQVFLNILENVHRHAYGATWIEIHLNADLRAVTIRISDDGCGMGCDLIESESNTDRGTGIGLLVCRSIVNAHGGQIELQESAQGTQVQITLPVKENKNDKR